MEILELQLDYLRETGMSKAANIIKLTVLLPERIAGVFVAGNVRGGQLRN